MSTSLPAEAIDDLVLGHIETQGSEEGPVSDLYGCGCHYDPRRLEYRLCRYHDGMNDGMAMVSAENDRLKEELEVVRLMRDSAMRLLEEATSRSHSATLRELEQTRGRLTALLDAMDSLEPDFDLLGYSFSVEAMRMLRQIGLSEPKTPNKEEGT